MIKGLHHNAYRCRDSEETRRFYAETPGCSIGRSPTLELKGFASMEQVFAH